MRPHRSSPFRVVKSLNGAFGKRSFCWGDTGQFFVILVDFRGLRSKIPSFWGQNAISEISLISVKTTCFWQGTKRPFPKRPFRQPWTLTTPPPNKKSYPQFYIFIYGAISALIHSLQNHLLFWGLGFCRFFCVFVLASIFQTNGIFKPIFCADFWCADFCAHFCADCLVRRFLHPFLAQIFGAQIFAPIFAQTFRNFSSTFWRLKNRCSRVTQKCTENARKNPRRPNGPARGGPHSLSAFPSRQHVTQSPLGRHTQGEHVSVHRDIFGLKGVLAFAPRFFKNKNLQKMSSAKPQPQLFVPCPCFPWSCCKC